MIPTCTIVTIKKETLATAQIQSSVGIPVMECDDTCRPVIPQSRIESSPFHPRLHQLTSLVILQRAFSGLRPGSGSGYIESCGSCSSSNRRISTMSIRPAFAPWLPEYSSFYGTTSIQDALVLLCLPAALFRRYVLRSADYNCASFNIYILQLLPL